MVEKIGPLTYRPVTCPGGVQLEGWIGPTLAYLGPPEINGSVQSMEPWEAEAMTSRTPRRRALGGGGAALT
jgi:hypothetical protein